MNKPLTAEEAKNLTFPCLLEVWDNIRNNRLAIVEGITTENLFLASTKLTWDNAALPSPEIAEAMRKQFGTQSEYPKRMLVWDSEEAEAVERIVIADLGEKAIDRYIAVLEGFESKFENGEWFRWSYYRNAKPIPDPAPIAQEIAELRQMLADLEAKYNQQS